MGRGYGGHLLVTQDTSFIILNYTIGNKAVFSTIFAKFIIKISSNCEVQCLVDKGTRDTMFVDNTDLPQSVPSQYRVNVYHRLEKFVCPEVIL